MPLESFELVIKETVTSLSKSEVESLSLVCPRIIEKSKRDTMKARDSLYSRKNSNGRKSTINERATERVLDSYADRPVRIFYVKLCNELSDLALLALPINMIYERFEPPLMMKKPKAMSVEEKEHAELFNFQDPRLQHLKTDFSRKAL